MNINEIVLSIVKRPSFNLLAFQGMFFIFFLLAGELVVQELGIFGKWEYAAIRIFQIIYTLLFGIPTVLYTLIIFIIDLLCKKHFCLLWNKYTILLHFLVIYILFRVLMLPESYDFCGAPGMAIVFLFFGGIISIISFSIIPLIITLITEQIRGTRIENLPYLNSKLKLTGVIFCAAFPVVFWSSLAIYTIYISFSIKY